MMLIILVVNVFGMSFGCGLCQVAVRCAPKGHFIAVDFLIKEGVT